MHRLGNAHEAGRTIDLSTVLSFVWRGAPLAVFMALFAGATAYLINSNADPVYHASIALVASQPGSAYANLDVVTPPTIDPAVYRSALLEGTIVTDALLRVTGKRPSERELELFLRTLRVTIESQQLSSVIRLRVAHGDPEYAARVANAIADELIVWDRERARRTLSRGVSAIERSIADIDAEVTRGVDAARAAVLTTLRAERIAELQMVVDTTASAVVVGLLEPLRLATPPERPVGPRVVFATFVAAVLGLVLGYALALVRLALDRRIGDRETVTELTGLPVLAEFAVRPRSAHRLSGETASFLRTNLAIATRGTRPVVIVVTSAVEIGEKDRVALSLAESFARSGQKTLLVDADLRYPNTTKWIDVVPGSVTPFETHLAHPDRRFDAMTVSVGSRQGFDFVPSFTAAPFPVDALNQGLPACLEGWSARYDVIILDSTPVVPFADTLAIAPLATGVVLCASVRRSHRDQLSDAVRLLERAQVRLLGVALTELSVARARRVAAAERPIAEGERQSIDPYRTSISEPRRPNSAR